MLGPGCCCDKENEYVPEPGCEEGLPCFGDKFGYKSIFIPPAAAFPVDPYNPRGCVNIGMKTYADSQPISETSSGQPAGTGALWATGDMSSPCFRKWTIESESGPYLTKVWGCGFTEPEYDVTVKRIRVEVFAGLRVANSADIFIHEVVEIVSFPAGGSTYGNLSVGDYVIGVTGYTKAGPTFGEVTLNKIVTETYRVDNDGSFGPGSLGATTICRQSRLGGAFCIYPDKVYMQFCEPCQWDFWIENCALNWEIINGYAVIIERVGAHWLDGGVVHSSTNPIGSFALEPGQQYRASVVCSILDAGRLFPYQVGIFELDPEDNADCFIPCNRNCSPDWGLEQNSMACYPCGCERGQGISYEMRVWNVRDSADVFKTCPIGTGGSYNYHEYRNWGILNGSWAWNVKKVFNGVSYQCATQYETLGGEAIYRYYYKNPVIGNFYQYEPQETVYTVWFRFRLVKGWLGVAPGGIEYQTRALFTRGGEVVQVTPYADNWYTIPMGCRGHVGPATDEHCGIRFSSCDHNLNPTPEICAVNGLQHNGGIATGFVGWQTLMIFYGSMEAAAYVENPLCP